MSQGSEGGAGSSLREFDWIAWLSSRIKSVPGVPVGIGDDAAVLERGRFDLAALDTMVEGVHFRHDWSRPEDVGWKLLATNLSDIAAMGGEPGPYLLALSLPRATPSGFLEGFVAGLEAAAQGLAPGFVSVAPIGGDTTRSPGPLVLSLTLLGSSPEAGAVMRDGASPGDWIGVVGGLGEAAAGLAWLSSQEGRGGQGGAPWLDGDRSRWASLLEAHRRPQAQVSVGAALGASGLVNAMLDVSDGFAQDLGHILRASEVGARVEAQAVPVSPLARELAAAMGSPELARSWSLSGGDDYALVVVVSPSDREAVEAVVARRQGSLSWVGRCAAPSVGAKLVLEDGSEASLGGGYEHHFGGAAR